MWPLPFTTTLRNLVAMAKNKSLFYAVANGRRVGIFTSWPECEAQVKGFPKQKYKSFPTHGEAHEYIMQLNWDYKNQHEKANTQQQQHVDHGRGDGNSSQRAIVIEDDGEDRSASSSRSPFQKAQGSSSSFNQHSTGATKRKHSKWDAEEADSYVALKEKIDAADTISGQLWQSSNEEASDRTTTTGDNSKRSAASESSSNHLTKKPKLKVAKSESSSSSPSTDLVIQNNGGVRIIEVYTDGACTSNGKLDARAGWGVYWPESQDPKSDLYGKNESKRLPGDRKQQTNNRAELMGLIRALQICPDKLAQLVVYTDSQYCINAINEWQHNWRTNKWMTSAKMPVNNKDLIRRLEREMRSRSLRPRLVKVKGHSTNKGNCEADRLAVMGAKLPTVAPHLWPEMEPSDSEDESDELIKERAINSWAKFGYTREQAQQKVTPSSQ